MKMVDRMRFKEILFGGRHSDSFPLGTVHRTLHIQHCPNSGSGGTRLRIVSVVPSLCSQAWLLVVTFARFGPMKHVPPIPPLANVAVVGLSIHLGQYFLVMYASVCVILHILDNPWTINCTA